MSGPLHWRMHSVCYLSLRTSCHGTCNAYDCEWCHICNTDHIYGCQACGIPHTVMFTLQRRTGEHLNVATEMHRAIFLLNVTIAVMVMQPFYHAAGVAKPYSAVCYITLCLREKIHWDMVPSSLQSLLFLMYKSMGKFLQSSKKQNSPFWH